MNISFLLFYSPKPRCQVWILRYRNWSIRPFALKGHWSITRSHCTLQVLLIVNYYILSAPKHRKRLFCGVLPLCQRFRKFRSDFKWKGLFRFLPAGIFGIASGGGPLISVGIFRPKFVVPFLINRFFALIRDLGKEIKTGKSHSYWLARFNRKMSFHSSGIPTDLWPVGLVV